MASWFNPNVLESMEMLYQMGQNYLFSSDKFESQFQFEPTSYKRGVVETLAAYVE